MKAQTLSRLCLLVPLVLFSLAAFADPPIVVDPHTGKYLGNLGANKVDPNCICNPYGQYGSKFSPDSVNNPYGRYGSPFSLDSTTNPYSYGSSSLPGYIAPSYPSSPLASGFLRGLGVGQALHEQQQEKHENAEMLREEQQEAQKNDELRQEINQVKEETRREKAQTQNELQPAFVPSNQLQAAEQREINEASIVLSDRKHHTAAAVVHAKSQLRQALLLSYNLKMVNGAITLTTPPWPHVTIQIHDTTAAQCKGTNTAKLENGVRIRCHDKEAILIMPPGTRPFGSHYAYVISLRHQKTVTMKGIVGTQVKAIIGHLSGHSETDTEWQCFAWMRNIGPLNQPTGITVNFAKGCVAMVLKKNLKEPALDFSSEATPVRDPQNGENPFDRFDSKVVSSRSATVKKSQNGKNPFADLIPNHHNR
jgi:hypothetical protein